VSHYTKVVENAEASALFDEVCASVCRLSVSNCIICKQAHYVNSALHPSGVGKSSTSFARQWRRQDFVTGGSQVWVYRGSRVRSPPAEADTFTAVHREFVGFGSCRVIRRSSMTMKAHTYCIIFGRPPIGGSFPLPSPPLAAPLLPGVKAGGR